ncbi:head GIN domain-containing protein [Croceitalea rosinachiae]|uniref:Head GIN domain-containing protein n=1 Tax=Croceitalea rosinachiae TaxID=3075596 RepID=A0ABU3AB27_9FLAO|nr:head GIN domain-containing protein [Croceitalea sp. F388]MDT0606283.1 head GIN domain-containing protein [Croceitalea sp. F388]
MKKQCFVLSLFFLLQGLYAQEEKIIQELQKFTELKAFDGLAVNLIPSTENKAVITGANTQKVVIVNNGGKLKIRMQLDKIFSGYRTFIDLYFTEKLTLVDVNEDARITSEETFTQEVLELRAQEGGELELNCQTEQMLVKAVTGGKVTTSGFTDNQDIIINTGGSYNGSKFKSKFTTISVNAGGNATLYATKYVKADVKAGGTVKVYGDPEKMDEKTVFGGKIERVE